MTAAPADSRMMASDARRPLGDGAHNAMAMPDTFAPWTLADLHRLPEDGNRYELVRGELFVTPAPSYRHQRLASVLGALLQPYVAAERLGEVCHPRSIVRIGKDTEV